MFLDGVTVGHPGDVVGQTRESMANIAAVVDEANRQRRSAAFTLAELSYRVYVRHARDFQKIRDTLKPLIGQAEIVYLQADICRHDLLLEIEAFDEATINELRDRARNVLLTEAIVDEELAKVLTPQQLEEYLLRWSQNSAQLREQLRGLDVTPEEFRALFRAAQFLTFGLVKAEALAAARTLHARIDAPTRIGAARSSSLALSRT